MQHNDYECNFTEWIKQHDAKNTYQALFQRWIIREDRCRYYNIQISAVWNNYMK